MFIVGDDVTYYREYLKAISCHSTAIYSLSYAVCWVGIADHFDDRYDEFAFEYDLVTVAFARSNVCSSVMGSKMEIALFA